MKDLNQVFIIGRLVRDPEIKYTAGGMAVTKFSIANNESYTQDNQKKEYTNYFDVTVWGNQGINCEKYLNKGSQIAIIGSLKQNRWTDKASNQVKSKVEITANSVQFLTPKSEAKSHNSNVGQVFEADDISGNGLENPFEDPWGNNKKDDEIEF